MKPILFNTEMVRAILDGRKTQTRRLVKPQPQSYSFDGRVYIFDEDELPKQSYQPGDILWVRETWSELKYPDGSGRYVYKASDEYPFGEDGYIVKFRWHPSIHMPREAARLFLRVTDVRVERLQKCGDGWCLGIEREGIRTKQDPILYINDDEFHNALREEMCLLWDRTIKKADLDRYGWDANPLVWVYTFKQCGKDGESWNG